ncbi:MAG: excisionase family DNA binding protein [Planctomycetaceae bacterium]|jgi:excisionase family DNA binding protein
MALIVSPRVDQGQPKMAVSYQGASKALDVCERSVWQLVKDGKLKAIRIGRSVRIPVSELERFVANSGSEVPP